MHVNNEQLEKEKRAQGGEGTPHTPGPDRGGPDGRLRTRLKPTARPREGRVPLRGSPAAQGPGAGGRCGAYSQVALVEAEQDAQECHQQEGQADGHHDGFDLPLGCGGRGGVRGGPGPGGSAQTPFSPVRAEDQARWLLAFPFARAAATSKSGRAPGLRGRDAALPRQTTARAGLAWALPGAPELEG